ncbi:MAG: sugar phosphate isomerase/epimerase [Planctomycetota bacterium]|jgi:sugar phosphate isomerase/epimerase|nr:sugar phosphate isomerase/epimerase [Planctomycetota bacterium]MDP6504377.1 sugar phosphate isomerase/epimerase [Planctomycetota bacterium]
MKIGTRIPPVGGEMGFPAFFQWLSENGFGAVDVSELTEQMKSDVESAGLQVGTIDCIGITKKTLSANEDTRAEGVAEMKELISSVSALGGKILFTVLLPDDPTIGRAKNFDIWKETWPEILDHAEANDVVFAIEWYPGGAPYYPALGCTPEMWRKMYAVSSSKALGMCYDPSHLARLQIDWMRALHELGDRITHVHAKDTEIFPELLYEQGTLGASFGAGMGFSEGYWRYCIPGDGVVNWRSVQERLEHFGFDGIFSVELEDYRYWKDGDAQKEGLLASHRHLSQFVR